MENNKEKMSDEIINNLDMRLNLNKTEKDKIKNILNNFDATKITNCKRTSIKKFLYDNNGQMANIYNPNLKQRYFILELVKSLNKGKLTNEELYIRLLSMLTNLNFDTSDYDEIINILNDPNDFLIEIGKEIYGIVENICSTRDELVWHTFIKNNKNFDI